MYTALLFDFYDVIHSDPFNVWMQTHGLKREGIQAAASSDLDHGVINNAEFFRRLGLITGQTAEEVEAEFRIAAKIDYQMVALVRNLKQNYTIGLISNAESNALRATLRDNELESLFHDIVISSEVGLAKPEPAIFKHALEVMKVVPGQTVFIDDNPHNIVAAENLGIKGLVFTDCAALQIDLKALGVYS